MRQLRELGIYRSPDGGEHVAVAGLFGFYLLYGAAAFSTGFPAYVVEPSGRIVSAARPTAWRAEDLLDTGRTYGDVYSTRGIPRAPNPRVETARLPTTEPDEDERAA
ncbi:MAG TPA: hypothetical protein VIP46_02045 [Pyrinomonadaceae bacterium]